MRLPQFEYVEPEDTKEALAILHNEPTAKILAGGTDLLVNMKHRVERPSVLVNIKRITDLDYIRQDSGSIRVGALTSLKRLHGDSLVLENFPSLAKAASAVGSYHHQVMGTVGGNICQQNRCVYFNQSQWWRSSRPTCYKPGGEICHVVHRKETCYSSYCGDLAPTLLVLDARIVIQSSNDSREIPLETLFNGNGKAPLNVQKGEILTEIIIPAQALDGFSTYLKFANRESIDFPIVGTAFWASMKRKEYRVAFTAVDRKPLRGSNVEALLKGKDLSEELLKEAHQIASKEATVVKTSIYSPSYKRRIMGLLLRSALQEAMRKDKQ